LVVISIIGMLMALLLPQIQAARETARGNTCRSNMRAVANAVFQYGNDNGRYPGYMNVLQLENGQPFKNPNTGTLMPVSWAVLIFPYIDRRPTFDQWRKDWTNASSSSSGSGSAGSSGGGAYVSTRFFTDQYIDLFLCPSDPQQSKTGTPISFVVNSGQQDAVSAIPSGGGSGSGGGTGGGVGIPRDWGANGMFFDNYNEHQLIKTTTTNRGPMEYMSDARVKDPHAMTIMLTENIDAQNYVFNINSGSATWQYTEVEVGSIWGLGTVDRSTTPPTMMPQLTGASSGGNTPQQTATGQDSLRINNSRGKGDGISYAYCRPSSNHPQSVNVAFVGQNVQQLKDSISYFVFAKLMASDDDNIKQVGANTLADAALRTYPITEADYQQ